MLPARAPARPFKPQSDAPAPAGAPQPMLTPQSACKLFCRRTGGCISLSTFYRWIANGHLAVIRINSRFLVPLAEVERIIAASYGGERL